MKIFRALFISVFFSIFIGGFGCGGSSSSGGGSAEGDGSDGSDGSDGGVSASELVRKLQTEDALVQLIDENSPFLYRPAIREYYPEVDQLIAMGGPAIPDILQPFQREPSFVDDTPLLALAYTIEQIGDPSAVPALTDWLETNMFGPLDWSREFVTHTIKVLDGQQGRNEELFIYSIDEQFDTVNQARVGADPTGPITAARRDCEKTLRVSGIGADGNAVTVSVPFNTRAKDIDELIGDASGEQKQKLERIRQGWREADEAYDATLSDYQALDPNEDVSRLSNCGGEVVSRVLNELLLRKQIPLVLNRGNSDATQVRDLASTFGDEVDLADADVLTVTSHEVDGKSMHVEVPISGDENNIVIFSKDNYGKRYTHTVSRNPLVNPYGPVAIKYGERPWFLPGSGNVTTKYYRINPNRITDIVVDSSRCPCDPGAPDAVPISITSPGTDETDQRVITISGIIDAEEVLAGTTLSVNGNPQNIQVTDRSFQATVVLRSGENTITVSAETFDGRCGIATRTIRSTTPQTTLSATLTWNIDQSDLDLYVTQPDSETSWYSNLSTSIGGRLDVDNTRGFGPENYFLSSVEGDTILEGGYEIRVHYYDDDLDFDDTPTRAAQWRVVVLTNEGTDREKRQVFTGALSSADVSNDSPEATGADWGTVATIQLNLAEP